MSRREGGETNGSQRFQVMFVFYVQNGSPMITALVSPWQPSIFGVFIIKAGRQLSTIQLFLG